MNSDRRRDTPRAATLAVLLAVLAGGFVAGPASGTVPPLSCAAGDPGVHYTAPSNLTVADASNATVDSPFASNDSIAIGTVTTSAGGDAFVRIEGATGPACLSDVDATTVPVTITTDDATVSVEGNVSVLAFDDPANDDVALAYRAESGPTVTLVDAGHPAGTPLDVIDDGANEVIDTATVADDGSVSLSLPASADGTRLRLETAATDTPGSDTGTPSPTATDDGDPTMSDAGAAGGPTTRGSSPDGIGALPILLILALLALLVAALVVRDRRD